MRLSAIFLPPCHVMRRAAARIAGATFGRALIGNGLAAPALVRAASVTVPSLQLFNPASGHSNLRFALGLGAGLGVLLSQPDATDCAPKRKQPVANPAPAKNKKKAGPALSAIEAALELQDGEYNVEKIIADRLTAGKKEYLVKWKGYADKHNTWEPVEHLANVVADIAQYHKDKDATCWCCACCGIVVVSSFVQGSNQGD